MSHKNTKSVWRSALGCLAALATVMPAVTLDVAAQEQRRGNEGGSVAINNQAGRVQVKLERGGKVAVNNRYGRITITGWDRDTVEATATSDKGPEAIQVEVTADPSAGSVLSLNVPGRRGRRDGLFTPQPSVAPRPARNPKNASQPQPAQPAQPAQTAPVPPPTVETPVASAPPQPPVKGRVTINPEVVVTLPKIKIPAGIVNVEIAPQVAVTPRAYGDLLFEYGVGNEGQGIHLDVKVPRYAELEAIEVRTGELNVSGLDGPISIASGGGKINVSRVGSLELRARSGDINVEDVGGLVYIVATSSDIKVRRSGGDVRAVTINGDIDIQCVTGRVDASNARGAITLANVSGDVEATTTSADVVYTGPIKANGRYRLKSMEGGVQMSIPETSPGFTATLASYNNEVQTDFPLKPDSAVGGTSANRRGQVRQGDGGAVIMLDSFSQSVRLSKAATGAVSACK